MLSLRNYFILSKKCSQSRYFSSSVVLNHWNKDYKPASHPPTTEDGRRLAAEKYGLLPSEYKTFPDDGTGYGDYPNIPAVSGEARDNYYPWDNPELKRNFNEVLHVDEDIIGEDRCNVNEKLLKSRARHFGEFFIVMGAFLTVYYWLDNKKQFLPLIPKQYPNNKHYTFEQKS